MARHQNQLLELQQLLDVLGCELDWLRQGQLWRRRGLDSLLLFGWLLLLLLLGL